jgi:hypothetical protein
MTLRRLALGLTVLLGLLTGASGVAKLSGVEGVLLNAARWGFTPSTFAALGALQLLITALFVVPRTALLGGLLQLAYFGGAIATHVEHGDPVAPPVIIEALFFITLFARFPQLRAVLAPERNVVG